MKKIISTLIALTLLLQCCMILSSAAEKKEGVTFERMTTNGADHPVGYYETEKRPDKMFRTYEAWVYIPKSVHSSRCGIILGNYQSFTKDQYVNFEIHQNGVPRLVRVSPYNAQGKRMTSFASVFVVPLIDDTIDIHVDPAGISWDTFRSSGAGGQNVNKVESGVRLHYKFINPLTNQPDEIVIENTETRDQPKNRENALRHLRSQLYELELEKRRQAAAKVEAGKKKIEWGSQIRSYVFDDRRVKDHRTNYQTSNVNAVMDGDIDAFIKAYLMEFPD